MWLLPLLMRTAFFLLMSNLRVIGIDPGYDRCGVAIAEKDNGREVLLFSTCITTNKSDLFSERVRQVIEGITTVIETYTPAALALETLFFNQNRKTALQVAEVRGAILHTAASRGIAIHEYSPQAVKIAITGHGKSDKQSVAAMIERLYHPKTAIQYDDEYDAIAIAMTALAHTASRTP